MSDKHQLKYCVIYGTLLGAIRHKGFIPRDDNLDVVMPGDDFGKFKLVANDELPEHLFFQDYGTDKNYPALTAKVRDGNTTMMENGLNSEYLFQMESKEFQ